MGFYQNEEPKLRRAVHWIVDIVVVIAIAWFTVYAFGNQVKIAGSSMTPLLNPEDVVLMNRITYDFSDPSRLDVVVFKREDLKSNVKRIIGLPEETVQIKDGSVYIDGEQLVTRDGPVTASLAGLAENPVKLGPDEYFLLGVNCDSSEDSRFVNVGNVKKEQILGKVWLRIFPILDLDLIG